MALPVTGQVGEINVAGGTNTSPIRQGNQGDVIVSELHGRFYEGTLRGRAYAGGMTALTSINAATFTSATLGATCTPIWGIWNPLNSGINVELLQVMLGITLTTLTGVVGGGPYVWAGAGGQAGLTLGNLGFSRKTFAANGAAKVFGGQALTGLTGSLVVLNGSAIGGGTPVNVAQTYTVAGIPQFAGAYENLDGSWVIPPGGVLALLGTATPVGHSATSGGLWNEIPVVA